jgi:hypothetical protein
MRAREAPKMWIEQNYLFEGVATVNKLLLAGFLGAVSMISAPIVTVTPTLGPNPSSANFSAWVTNMINGLRGLSAPPVGTGAQQYDPLVNGSSVDAGKFIATEILDGGFDSWQGVAPGPFAGEQGTTLYFALTIQDTNPLNSFSLSQITVSETYVGTGLGTSLLGGDYRSTLVGERVGGILLQNGESSIIDVNALYYVGVGFSWQAEALGGVTNQEKINANIAAIQALADRTTQVCYSVLTYASGCGNVEVPGAPSGIPEPGTWALMGAGLAGLAFLRRKA